MELNRLRELAGIRQINESKNPLLEATDAELATLMRIQLGQLTLEEAIQRGMLHEGWKDVAKKAVATGVAAAALASGFGHGTQDAQAKEPTKATTQQHIDTKSTAVVHPKGSGHVSGVTIVAGKHVPGGISATFKTSDGTTPAVFLAASFNNDTHKLVSVADMDKELPKSPTNVQVLKRISSPEPSIQKGDVILKLKELPQVVQDMYKAAGWDGSSNVAVYAPAGWRTDGPMYFILFPYTWGW